MNILQKLENQEVLIIGDVMLDRYLTGDVSRISPEAPVPVVLHSQTTDRLGGAANVALNVQALGSIPILCSVVGSDPEGGTLQNILASGEITTEGILSSSGRRTTVKTRILAGNHQMLRIDTEDTFDLTDEESRSFIQNVLQLLEKRDIRVVIFQDYNKGVLTQTVIRTVIEAAKKRGILTAADPKKANFFAYAGIDLFKPNLKEIRDSAPFPVHPDQKSLQSASDFLRERLQNRTTMITLSEKGLFLDDSTGAGRLFPTVPRNVSDVSGAGDTVISIAALGMAAGLDMETIALLSNLAGGQVCELPGVAPVSRDILAAELEHWLYQHPAL